MINSKQLLYNLNHLNIPWNLLSKITDRTFNNIPVRVYDPESREKFGGAVVYYHGGGWTVGSVGKYGIATLTKDGSQYWGLSGHVLKAIYG